MDILEYLSRARNALETFIARHRELIYDALNARRTA